MKNFKTKLNSEKPMFGIGSSLGSNIFAELAGRCGFDWLWIDLEHGIGDVKDMSLQIQAVSDLEIAPIVRLPSNDAAMFKKALDLGAEGIMIPFVSTAAEAKAAAKAMKYAPEGIRGVAKFTRAAEFGQNFDKYFANANKELTLVVQIETEEGVNNIEEIAQVDGVDVIFVGPLDLSVSMGIAQQYNHPKFIETIKIIQKACEKYGKVPGILVPGITNLPTYLEMGFKFLVVGSDGSILSKGLQDLLKTCKDEIQVTK